jgi:hypothetical protein
MIPRPAGGAIRQRRDRGEQKDKIVSRIVSMISSPLSDDVQQWRAVPGSWGLVLGAPIRPPFVPPAGGLTCARQSLTDCS